MAELKGTGTVIQVARQLCRHGPEQPPLRLAQVHVSKRDAREDSKDTIAVSRPDMMNLWL